MLRTAIAGFIGVMVGAAVVSVGVGQQEVPGAKVMRAKRFELVGAKGNVRGVLAVLPDGTVSLDLRDEKGNRRASLSLEPGSPALHLHDKNGNPRASLSLLPDGTPGLQLFGENGKQRALLSVLKGNYAVLAMQDENGKLIWSAP